MSESFWQFSLRTYSKEPVPEACLALQNQHGVDVNLLLFSLWFGMTRGVADENLLREVFEFSRSWASHVVVPLRGIRTWMKTEGCDDARIDKSKCQEYRERVKKLELAGEKMQQEVLQTLVADVDESQQAESAQVQAMLANCRAYFLTLGLEMKGEVNEQVATIIVAALGGIARDDVLGQLSWGSRS